MRFSRIWHNINWILFLVMGAAAVAAAQQSSLQEVTEHMQQRYDSMENAVARFTQHVKFGFSKIEQKFSGTLTMKKPNKVRLESEHQTVVTDGATVWAYSPVNKQVVIDKYKENQNSISPDRFLMNLPAQYYTNLLGKEIEGGVPLAVLKLVPKDDRSFVKSIKLWVEENTWLVRKIVVVDVNDTETTYTISEFKLNGPMKENSFTFTPPPGTEVVDLR